VVAAAVAHPTTATNDVVAIAEAEAMLITHATGNKLVATTLVTGSTRYITPRGLPTSETVTASPRTPLNFTLYYYPIS
jgi:hypothetical protein